MRIFSPARQTKGLQGNHLPPGVHDSHFSLISLSLPQTGEGVGFGFNPRREEAVPTPIEAKGILCSKPPSPNGNGELAFREKDVFPHLLVHQLVPLIQLFRRCEEESPEWEVKTVFVFWRIRKRGLTEMKGTRKFGGFSRLDGRGKDGGDEIQPTETHFGRYFGSLWPSSCSGFSGVDMNCQHQTSRQSRGGVCRRRPQYLKSEFPTNSRMMEIPGTLSGLMGRNRERNVMSLSASFSVSSDPETS